MNRDDASRILSEIDESYIVEAAVFSPERKPRRRETGAAGKSKRAPSRFAAAAACAALALLIGSAVFAFAAEAKQYQTAVSFFAENGLSAEGLRREEVKAVYRDITQNRFSYGKTAEVLLRAVPGWEIRQAQPSPEALAAIWNGSILEKPIAKKGFSFRSDPQYRMDPEKGFEVLDTCVLACYRDGEALWQTEFRDFYVEGCQPVTGGTAVWGQSEVTDAEETMYAWLALVDENGGVRWQQRLEHGFSTESVAAAVCGEDGTLAVIGRGDLRYLCLSRYDLAGKELAFRKTEVGNLGIWNAAALGDGYIVQLGNRSTRDTALLYFIDREGRVTDSFSYQADDCEYYITDLTAFAGQVYLSAYAVPGQEDEGGRHEIGNVLDYIFNEKDGAIEDGELTPLVRDNYTAVLLVCDPAGGSPKTFWSVKGALGGALTVNGDALEWDVESIVSTFFSPATSAYTVGGTCRVYRCTFNAAGALTEQADTGETVPYFR